MKTEFPEAAGIRMAGAMADLLYLALNGDLLLALIDEIVEAEV